MTRVVVLNLIVIVTVITAIGCGDEGDPLVAGTEEAKFRGFLEENVGAKVNIHPWEDQPAVLEAIRLDYIIVLVGDHEDIQILVPIESIVYVAVTPEGTLTIELR